jgi:hypothetical protein
VRLGINPFYGHDRAAGGTSGPPEIVSLTIAEPSPCRRVTSDDVRWGMGLCTFKKRKKTRPLGLI